MLQKATLARRDASATALQWVFGDGGMHDNARTRPPHRIWGPGPASGVRGSEAGTWFSTAGLLKSSR